MFCAGHRRGPCRPGRTTWSASTGCSRGCGASFRWRRGHSICARTPSVLGAPFFLMEYRPGISIGADLPPALVGRPAEAARIAVGSRGRAHRPAPRRPRRRRSRLPRPPARIPRPPGRGLVQACPPRLRRAAGSPGPENRPVARGPRRARARGVAGAQRLQARQRAARPRTLHSGGGGRLGHVHARMSSLRPRHPAELLDRARRSPRHAHSSADAERGPRLSGTRRGP